MPRTRRAVPAAAVGEEPAAISPPPANDPAAEPAPTETAAPKRTRRRASAASVPTEEPSPAGSAAAPEPQAPVASSPASEAAPRRRGRRQGAVAAEPAPAASAPESATPAAAPDPAPSRRGRARGRVAVEPPAADPAAAAPEPKTAAEPAAAAPRSRGRRRTSVAEAPAQLPDLEAPVAEGGAAAVPAAEEAAEPAQGERRRRGRRRAPAAEAPAQLPDLEAPVAEEGAAAAPAAEEAAEPAEGERRGRRTRRGRRGRHDNVDELLMEAADSAGSDLLVGAETVAYEEATESEEDDLLVYPPPAPPVYVAPPLVPPVFAPAEGGLLPRTVAHVQHPAGPGLPQIAINGHTHAPYLFFVNAEAAESGDVVDSQIHGAAAAGIHLYSAVMYLPLRNAYGERSFGPIDALVQQVLAADPDGYLLPRLQFVPTNYWARTHPDQMARYTDGSEGDVSLASTEFWADCVDALESLIAHFADPSTPGGDRIIGFHLDRGEWFYDQASGYDYSAPNRLAFQNWLHAKYQALYALRAAWYDGSVTFEDADIPAGSGRSEPSKKGETPLYATAREGRWIDYAEFASNLVAQILAGLASAVKTLSDGRLLVAASYGYTLEFATRNDSGHLAMAQVLGTPEIDIVAGPNSYAGRGAGGPSAFGALVDSVALHGKLWLVEDDTKTFLAQSETDDTYNPRIAAGADTRAIHQRHFGAALAHKAGVSWMDLWGQGWLDSPDIWQELGGLCAQAERWRRLVPEASVPPDVAVLVDEASLRFIRNDPAGLGAQLILRTRDLLLRAGASVGFYLQSDITRANFPESTLYLFLNALRVTTAEKQAVRERLQRPGKTLAWLYAPGLFDENGPATDEISDTVGMVLRLQPWNSRGGSQLTEMRHPITERLRGGKRIGQEDILNPSYAVHDPQATVLAEYAGSGAPSLAVREHADGWKTVFFGDPHLTTELLRGLYAYAGVPLYDTQDDVVYAAGDGVLLVHAPYTGQRTLTLPRRATIYDALENRIIATNTRSFRSFLRARTTRLFLWGTAEAIMTATGLSLPEESPAPTPEELARAEREMAEEAAGSPAAGSPPALVLPGLPEPPDLAPPFPADHSGVSAEVFEVEAEEIALETAVGGAEDEADAAETAEDSAGLSAPRSRWQRRRAARARRAAERRAQTEGGTAEGGDAAGPTLDIAALLPDLPPRRKDPGSPPAGADPDGPD